MSLLKGSTEEILKANMKILISEGFSPEQALYKALDNCVNIPIDYESNFTDCEMFSLVHAPIIRAGQANGKEVVSIENIFDIMITFPELKKLYGFNISLGITHKLLDERTGQPFYVDLPLNFGSIKNLSLEGDIIYGDICDIPKFVYDWIIAGKIQSHSAETYTNWVIDEVTYPFILYSVRFLGLQLPALIETISYYKSVRESEEVKRLSNNIKENLSFMLLDKATFSAKNNFSLKYSPSSIELIDKSNKTRGHIMTDEEMQALIAAAQKQTFAAQKALADKDAETEKLKADRDSQKVRADNAEAEKNKVFADSQKQIFEVAKTNREAFVGRLVGSGKIASGLNDRAINLLSNAFIADTLTSKKSTFSAQDGSKVEAGLEKEIEVFMDLALNHTSVVTLPSSPPQPNTNSALNDDPDYVTKQVYAVCDEAGSGLDRNKSEDFIKALSIYKERLQAGGKN